MKTRKVKQTLKCLLENCGSVKYETRGKKGRAKEKARQWKAAVLKSVKSNILLTSGVGFSIWDCPERKDFQLSGSEKERVKGRETTVRREIKEQGAQKRTGSLVQRSE